MTICAREHERIGTYGDLESGLDEIGRVLCIHRFVQCTEIQIQGRAHRLEDVHYYPMVLRSSLHLVLTRPVSP